MLLETIRLHNGILQNLFWHNRRSNAARLALFGKNEKWDLKSLIEVPTYAQQGLWKCRVLYSEKLETLDFQPYTPKKVNTIELMDIADFEYTYKFADRTFFQKVQARSAADDVLLVKNGLITDMSYANVAFFDGQWWWTPEQPLLEGTRRAQLLARKRIFSKKITVEDLKSYVGFRPINAMLQFGRTAMLPMDAIKNNLFS